MFHFEPYYHHITALCEQHNVKSLYVFGSATNDEFDDESDIDMIVDFIEMDYRSHADNYFELKGAFENLFCRNIDLLEHKAVKWYFLEAIDNHKRLLYACNSKSVAA